MLPVAAELVRRGDQVKFYSFREFEEKITASGAEFIACDSYLPTLTAQEEAGLKAVSTTEMTIQAIRITRSLDTFLDGEFKAFQPDVVYTDSVCFWGKLNAWKHQVPMVVSTSTFAFNELSSQYMKNSSKEIADMVFGLSRISKELKTLEPLGYHVKNALSLVQSDNDTDSIVYTSRKFQPYSPSFTGHYAFVGPSVFSNAAPDKLHERPLVFISMGTVINDRPDFYAKCIEALRDANVDVVISCGSSVDIAALGKLPENIQVFPSVDQLAVLSEANVFITHCGMNSVSESLYMATPMVLYPQTGEQQAVARRVTEMGAGVMLTDDSAEGIRKMVKEVLANKQYAKAAKTCSDDFRACPGTAGAADFIETAPHTVIGTDILKEMHKANAVFLVVFWLLVIALVVALCVLLHWKFAWIIGFPAGFLSTPLGKHIQMRKYQRFAEKQG